MNEMQSLITAHPFFKGFKSHHVELITECASNAQFQKGVYMFREGESADRLYLIREGKVAVEVQMSGKDPLAIMTISGGGVVGWSWLFPPYRWHFSVRVMEDTATIAFDAKCLLSKCKEDYELGYELMLRCSHIMGERLQATRLQLLNAFS